MNFCSDICINISLLLWIDSFQAVLIVERTSDWFVSILTIILQSVGQEQLCHALTEYLTVP